MRQIAGSVVITAWLATALVACSGGGDDTIQCEFGNPATIAASTWPKFRADVANTGTAPTVAISSPLGEAVWRFPAVGESPRGAFSASPVINNDGTRLYIGSNDGTMYAISTADGSEIAYNMRTSSPITSTAVAAVRNGIDAIFFGSGAGYLYAVDENAKNQASYWPFVAGSYVSASPVLSAVDGTVYMGTQSGMFSGVCPNGFVRWSFSTATIQSSAAIGPDSTIYFGGDDNQLRAFQLNGVFNWAFVASAAIDAAPVVEATDTATTAIFAADRGGRLFKVSPTGQPVAGFTFEKVGPISSSPALAGDRLYVGSDDGNLYAVNSTTGAKAWSSPFPTGGMINSSPAVALGGSAPVIVVGSNDGNVYFVRDDGTSATLLASFTIGAEVRSSPAIGADGTVYIGGMDGRVYAIR